MLCIIVVFALSAESKSAYNDETEDEDEDEEDEDEGVLSLVSSSAPCVPWVTYLLLLLLLRSLWLFLTAVLELGDLVHVAAVLRIAEHG